MFLYRDHRGSLDESMKTVQQMGSLQELKDHLSPFFGDGGVVVKPYAEDKRIGWDTHIVTHNGRGVGFTDGPVKDEMKDETIKFITESNMIEGIHRPPTTEEIAEHKRFLGLSEITIPDLEQFVSVYAGAKLRSKSNMDIQIGGLRLFGGPHVVDSLEELLSDFCSLSPFEAHVQYELLHPFMDGNGRSGRILWLWQMIELYGSAPLGFLHTFYYQTLQAQRK